VGARNRGHGRNGKRSIEQRAPAASHDDRLRHAVFIYLLELQLPNRERNAIEG
jgi:hypothetical protein